MGQQQPHHHHQQHGPPQSHHPHQQSSHQAPPHSNVPYYDQSMNLLNQNMQTGGQGGYNDPGVYHDANRYDWIYKFSLNNQRQSTELNAFDVAAAAVLKLLIENVKSTEFIASTTYIIY